MNAVHTQSLRSFAGRLYGLCFLRAAVKGATVWLFLWGVAVLVIRISSLAKTAWLSLALLLVVPIGLLAGWHACKQLPAFVNLRAKYDRLNAYGGLIMSEEAADMSAWQEQLPRYEPPKIRWHATKKLTVLCVSALFVATTLLLPDRLTRLSIGRHLEIGRLADQLRSEVLALHQEKIIPDNKADELQKQLAQIKADSSGYDPEKTWEALDHVKQSDSAAARQAAEEALAKTASLTQAQALAQAMQQAADNGMSDAAAEQAAQDLAKMLASAKLQDGLLNVNLPPAPVADLSGLNKEQLQKLLSAMQNNEEALEQTAADLANLKLIDADMLGQCVQAGEPDDPTALAAYLAGCKDGYDPVAMRDFLLPGKGGRGGGGPGSPMTWSDPKSEKDLKFQAHALPPAVSLSDAKLMGVSRSAPQVSGDAVVVEHDALAGAQGSGGSANAQVTLPEQRQAVRNYFQRDGK
jgi:hypothetical protein